MSAHNSDQASWEPLLPTHQFSLEQAAVARSQNDRIYNILQTNPDALYTSEVKDDCSADKNSMLPGCQSEGPSASGSNPQLDIRPPSRPMTSGRDSSERTMREAGERLRDVASSVHTYNACMHEFLRRGHSVGVRVRSVSRCRVLPCVLHCALSSHVRIQLGCYQLFLSFNTPSDTTATLKTT